MTKNTQGPLHQTNYNLMVCFKTGTILGPFFMLKRAFEEATIWPCHPWDGLRKKKELDGFASLDSFKEPMDWSGWFRKGMAMDQKNIKTYLLKMDFCTNLCYVSWEWTSICQLFSCSPGYQDVMCGSSRFFQYVGKQSAVHEFCGSPLVAYWWHILNW